MNYNIIYQKTEDTQQCSEWTGTEFRFITTLSIASQFTKI